MTFIKNITTWRSSLFCCHVQRGQTLGLFQPVNATTGAVGTSMNPSTQSRCSSERQKTCGAHQRGATMHGHLHCSQRIDKGAQTAPRDSACPANGFRQAQLGSNLPCVRGTGQDTPFRALAATMAMFPGSCVWELSRSVIAGKGNWLCLSPHFLNRHSICYNVAFLMAQIPSPWNFRTPQGTAVFPCVMCWIVLQRKTANGWSGDSPAS